MVRDLVKLQEAINKGAGVKSKRMMSNFNMRVPSEFLLKVDASRIVHHVGLTRNAWILEAMKEKLEKEKITTHQLS